MGLPDAKGWLLAGVFPRPAARPAGAPPPLLRLLCLWPSGPGPRLGPHRLTLRQAQGWEVDDLGSVFGSRVLQWLRSLPFVCLCELKMGSFLCLSCCSWKLSQDCEGLSCNHTL